MSGIAASRGRRQRCQCNDRVRSVVGSTAFAAGDIEAALRARHYEVMPRDPRAQDLLFFRGELFIEFVTAGDIKAEVYGGLELAEQIRTRGVDGVAATETLADIRAMALLGRYYSAKIRGATALAMFREARKIGDQREAVRHLTQASAFWDDYSRRAGGRYRNPLWTNRVGNLDWAELNAEVEHDIEIARTPLP